MYACDVELRLSQVVAGVRYQTLVITETEAGVDSPPWEVQVPPYCTITTLGVRASGEDGVRVELSTPPEHNPLEQVVRIVGREELFTDVSFRITALDGRLRGRTESKVGLPTDVVTVITLREGH